MKRDECSFKGKDLQVSTLHNMSGTLVTIFTLPFQSLGLFYFCYSTENELSQRQWKLSFKYISIQQWRPEWFCYSQINCLPSNQSPVIVVNPQFCGKYIIRRPYCMIHLWFIDWLVVVQRLIDQDLDEDTLICFLCETVTQMFVTLLPTALPGYLKAIHSSQVMWEYAWRVA